MPELPEVETVVRRIAPALAGRRVVSLDCDWPRMLRPGLRAARRLALGQSIGEVRRRGKFAVIGLGSDGAAILIHLRMSGRLAVVPSGEPASKHVHMRLGLTGGVELRFDDARKFGRVVVAARPDRILETVGFEPLEEHFSVSVLAGLLGRYMRRLKPLLLDQRVISGLGNIYTDESLHRARLHPLRRSDQLLPIEVKRLHAAIRETLSEGIAASGASIDWVYPGGTMQDRFRVYGRAGEPCLRCGESILRIVVGQRGTHFCPGCQR